METEKERDELKAKICKIIDELYANDEKDVKAYEAEKDKLMQQYRDFYNRDLVIGVIRLFGSKFHNFGKEVKLPHRRKDD